MMSARFLETLRRLSVKKSLPPARAPVTPFQEYNERSVIGRTLLHYQIIDKLGEGGMGVVYRARDTHLDRFVALKVLPPERVSDVERQRRFVQEAKAASALNHPNIVTIHDIATDQGVTFMAMELIEGKTLTEAIPRQGLRLGEALNYAVQVADGLAKAHQAGIIHRDLKPGNLMVAPGGRVKILDFGLAKLTAQDEPTEADATVTAGHLTDEGMIVGTASYMSPEQAEGRKLDARSDIFSFGIVLYEMLSGRRPFAGDNRVATISALLKDTPKPLEGIPTEVARLVDRCLRKDPDRRWQTMQDLRVALLEAKEDSDSGKFAAVAPAKPAKPARRRWPWAAAALAVLAPILVWQFKPNAAEKPQDLVPVPLTAYPGDERDPAFSPDGNQIAFSWGPQGGATNTYVKLVGAGDPIRLTHSPQGERMSQWSRDGKWIAFGRRGGPGVRGAFIAIPALGGPERIVAQPSNGSPYCFWTPDSRGLVISDGSPGSLYIAPLDGGPKRLLTGPLKNIHSAYFGSISPDGRTLMVGYGIGDYRPLYAIPLAAGYKADGEPRPLTPADWNVASHAWTPDSKEVVFIRAIGNANAGGISYMYRVGLDGSAPRRIDYVGDNPWFLDVAPQGNRLAYTRLQRDINLHRLELGPVGVAAKPSEAFASSSRREENASYSPDGARVVFASNRSGSEEIWTARSDGSNLVQVTNSSNLDGTNYPGWSPDGSTIVYVSRPQGQNFSSVFVISSTGGAPRQLTKDVASGNPSWSRDGRWVYFSRTGQIWKVASSGGSPVEVTRNGGQVARESPDGAWLYFTKPGASVLYRMPAAGGQEEEITRDVTMASFAPTTRGIYYLGRGPDSRSAFLRLIPLGGGDAKTLATISRAPHPGLSVSPDYKFVLFSQYDQSAADIMLVENFK